MNLHFLSPYSLEKNLGKAYNEAMALIPEDDWACFTDYDVMLLTPDAGRNIHIYAMHANENCLLTCFTNRVSPLSQNQLIGGRISENTDIRYHLQIAERQKQFLYQRTEINTDISGMLMLINKKMWMDFPFTEDKKCLGVDTEYNRRIRAAGKRIYRMDGIYVFHTYRLANGIHYKMHLK